MSTASLVVHQSRYDLKTFLRDPRAREFTLPLPPLLLLPFGYIFRHETFSYGRGVTIPGDSYYLPRMIVLGLASATLSNLVVVLVAKRENGALKRRRATPVRPVVLIGGDVITSEASGLIMAIVLTAVGWFAFKVHLTGVGRRRGRHHRGDRHSRAVRRRLRGGHVHQDDRRRRAARDADHVLAERDLRDLRAGEPVPGLAARCRAGAAGPPTGPGHAARCSLPPQPN